MTDELENEVRTGYAERGFLVLAFRFPREIGEIVEPEDDFLQCAKWKVVGVSDINEMRPMPICNLSGRYYFYRVEALD